MNEISLEVWGDHALFSRPESKVERLTYPVMTPSAARGILNAIYVKPVEFYWQVRRIEVLKPIRYMSFRRNEVRSRIGKRLKPILVEDERTQRQSVVLKDVRYRITASIIKRPGFKGTDTQLVEQARRRIKSGKCFFQPSLGTREFVCYFEEAGTAEPIHEDLDIGLMLYDVFDLHRFDVSEKTEPFITLFHAQMKNGVIDIPPFDDDAVLKPVKEG